MNKFPLQAVTTEDPEPTTPLNPFDPENLRLSQSFTETVE